MDINLTDKNLTKLEKEEIEKLFEREKQGLDDLEQMWYLMDMVWDDYGCVNTNLDWSRVGKFYSHPVWLLNGLFIEQDDTSMGHRHAISDWIVSTGFLSVVDYGGGFGTLARLIAKKDKNIHVHIYEPHPSDFGLKRAAEFENIQLVGKLGSSYDVLTSTDVLEHVPDPLKSLEEMIKSVRLNGFLVIANHFYPAIKCHLPSSMHLRHTFNIFARVLGLQVVGELQGSHALIYKKVKNVKPNWAWIRLVEALSKTIFPVISIIKHFLRPIKRVFS